METSISPLSVRLDPATRQEIIERVRERAVRYLTDVGAPAAAFQQLDHMLILCVEGRDVGVPEDERIPTRSRYTLIERLQILQYWYFDGVPLAARVLFFAGVQEGLYRLREREAERWHEFLEYMEEYRLRQHAVRASDAAGGWLFAGEAEVLWELAQAAVAVPGDFCELGAWTGRSALLWCHALSRYAPERTLRVVDNWRWGKEGSIYPFMVEGRDLLSEFRHNLRGLEKFYRTYQMLTEEAVKSVSEDTAGRGLALLFHDAGHSDSDVRDDLRLYVPLLNNGGYLVVHDYNHPRFPGVRKAVGDILEEFPGLEEERVFSTVGVFRLWHDRGAGVSRQSTAD